MREKRGGLSRFGLRGGCGVEERRKFETEPTLEAHIAILSLLEPSHGFQPDHVRW
jgi:hypothetical protein